MKTFKATIHFMDEGEPRIRSGRRIVLVKVGRRWIRITARLVLNARLAAE